MKTDSFVVITINMENDAFCHGNRLYEVKAVLERLTDKTDFTENDVVKLRDTNGNTVGKAIITTNKVYDNLSPKNN